ncbi:IS66 family transposase zinc-finger binding domain-containing protein [Vibrio harveyi]|uniref:IS66 family transposase zinc-finger binding domain-containing protein n=1 Tax=Vibrio harveyi TaxID=669 RepID=UPI00390A7E9C
MKLYNIGEDISEKLIFIHAKVEVEQLIRPKYVCRHCEHNKVNQPSSIKPLCLRLSSQKALQHKVLLRSSHHKVPI